MSLSSFCVVSNALRLNFFKLRDASRDRKIRKKEQHRKVISEVKEETTMEKTMQIKGMMCGHCEAAVKKALEALPEVEEAIVSHTDGTAVVKLKAQTADEMLKKAVEDKDYEVVSIR